MSLETLLISPGGITNKTNPIPVSYEVVLRLVEVGAAAGEAVLAHVPVLVAHVPVLVAEDNQLQILDKMNIQMNNDYLIIFQEIWLQSWNNLKRQAYLIAQYPVGLFHFDVFVDPRKEAEFIYGLILMGVGLLWVNANRVIHLKSNSYYYVMAYFEVSESNQSYFNYL